MTIQALFGWIACITSIIGLLPQIYKALKTGSTQDLSMLMLINYIVCSIAWIIYGQTTNASFVVISNILGLSTACTLTLLKLYYDRKHIKILSL